MTVRNIGKISIHAWVSASTLPSFRRAAGTTPTGQALIPQIVNCPPHRLVQTYAQPSRSSFISASRQKAAAAREAQLNGGGEPSGGGGTELGYFQRERFTDAHQLSQRVTKLAKANQLAQAIAIVKDQRSELADVAVWNNLLHVTLRTQNFKDAGELYMDMKRRGVRPNSRTYATMFAGYAASRKPLSSNVISRVRIAFAHWEKLVEEKLQQFPSDHDRTLHKDKVATQIPVNDDGMSIIPYNSYLTFLRRMSVYDVMLETFYSMPKSGLLAPDFTTYSIVLGGIKDSLAENPKNVEAAERVWESLTSRVAPDGIEDVLFSLMISIYRKSGQTRFHEKAVEIAESCYGFTKFENEHTLVKAGKSKPLIQMDGYALSNVLTLGLEMTLPDRVVKWFDQVRDYPNIFGSRLITIEHVELVLRALSYKKDAPAAEELLDWASRQERVLLKPKVSTWNDALRVCASCADIKRAYKLLSLMTGQSLRAGDSIAPLNRENFALADGDRRKHMLPDYRCANHLLATANATKDRGEISKTLRTLESLGIFPGYPDRSLQNEILAAQPENVRPKLPTQPLLETVNPTDRKFWFRIMCQTLERSLNRIMASVAIGNNENSFVTQERREALRKWSKVLEAVVYPDGHRPETDRSRVQELWRKKKEDQANRVLSRQTFAARNSFGRGR